MKQIISGRLAQTPQLKTIQSKETREIQQVTRFTVLAFDPDAPQEEPGIPLRCSAWGKNAETIGQMKEGELFTASTTMRYSEYLRGDGSRAAEPNYVVKRIDPDHEIQNQMAELLGGYEDGQYDQVFEKEAQPDFSGFGRTRDQPEKREPQPARSRSGEQDRKEMEP